MGLMAHDSRHVLFLSSPKSHFSQAKSFFDSQCGPVLFALVAQGAYLGRKESSSEEFPVTTSWQTDGFAQHDPGVPSWSDQRTPI